MAAPHIVVFDLETSPLLGYAWGTYQTDIIHLKEDWFLLSYAYQWYGKNKVVTKGLIDCKNPIEDRELIDDLWHVLDKADIVIGHNIDAFDIKKINARFLFWGYNSPSHYRTVDTLKVHKKAFKDTRNSLDYICQRHGIGQKVKHPGFDLWLRCMDKNLDTQAWRLMKKYNAHDVRINTELYKKLLPWIDTHPNLSTFHNELCCPNCASYEIGSDGIRFAQGTKYRRMVCKGCGTRFKQQIKVDGSEGKISGK